MAKKKKPEGQQMMDSRQREIQSLMEIKRLRMQAAENPDLVAEVLPEVEPIVPKTFKEKWDNYWYHYRLYTIMALGFVAIVAFVAYTIATETDYDLEVAFNAGHKLTSYAETAPEDIAAYLKDVDENGETLVLIDELSVVYSAIEGEDGQEMLADEVSYNNSQKLMSLIASGDPIVYILDQKNYDKLMKNAADGEMFIDLSEYFPNESRVKGDKLYFHETELGKKWRLDRMGSEYYLCLRPIGGVVSERLQPQFDAALEMMQNILSDTPVS